jgi:hypothetical protein
MITVVLAVALLAVGIAGVFFPSAVDEIIRKAPLGADLTKQLRQLLREETVFYLSALASPVLLIVGSLLRGI